MLLLTAILISCSSLLIGCGNSNNEQTDPIIEPLLDSRVGRFIDSPVAGISYLSGELTGITDEQGLFEYQLVDGVAQLISFSFNNIELGSTTGKAIITPLDLSDSATINDLKVINVTRFLIMLDSDGDPSNGIFPSQQLLDGVSQFTWDSPDFSNDTFEFSPTLAGIISDINSIDSQQHALPTSQQAQIHLRSSLSCLSSGIYAGDFDGGDNGHYVMLLQHNRVEPILFGDSEPRSGVTSALIYSRDQDRLIGVLPQQGLAFDNDNSFIVGQAVNGAQFSGKLTDFSTIENGDWVNQVEGGSGTFSGIKLAGDNGAMFRLAGAFGDNTPFDLTDDTADNRGGITFDIFSDNRVLGTIISARGNQIQINGTLNESIIRASSSDGIDFIVSFDKDGTDPLNSAAGLFGIPGFWGIWQRGSESGGIVGTSCQLNVN